MDSTLPARVHVVCSACDAALLSAEVVRERARVYGRHCCRRGQVALRPLRWGRDAAADRLMTDMWLTRPGRLSTSSLCRRHGRMLNATFAMSCQAVRCRPMLTRGMQTFVVNTRIAHYMGALLPDDGERPQFAQLYVHDAYTNAPVGSPQQFGHRDALEEYFARSRTGIGTQLQTALLALVATIRDVIVRVCCIRDKTIGTPTSAVHLLLAWGWWTGESICSRVAQRGRVLTQPACQRTATCSHGAAWAARGYQHIGAGRRRRGRTPTDLPIPRSSSTDFADRTTARRFRRS